MNRAIIDLIIGILAIGTLVYSFTTSDETGRIFGFVVNIWVYRAFWAAIGAVCILAYFKKSKKASN